MSAPSCLAFFGIKFRVKTEDIETVESRQHPLLKKAREGGLQHYWANFASLGERYLLFIGTRLGVLGIENDIEVVLDEASVIDVIRQTKAKLLQSGFDGEPALYIQWVPD